MNNRLNDYFETTDLSLSTTLVCLGFQIDYLDKSEQKVKFIFKSSPELNKAVQAFWTAELRIEPLTYFSNLKALKARLYSSEA